MADLVYIIEKIWVDSLENTFDKAVGYNPIGFVLEEQKAIEFCSKSRNYTSKDCWAIGFSKNDKTLPEYRYKPLSKIE